MRTFDYNPACKKEFDIGLAHGRQGEGRFLVAVDQGIGGVLPSTKRYESYLAGVREGLRERERGLTSSKAVVASGGGSPADSPWLLLFLGIYWPVLALGFALILPAALLKWMTVGGKHPVTPESHKVQKPSLTRMGIRVALAFAGLILLGCGDSLAGLLKNVGPYLNELAKHHYQFPDIWEWLEWFVLSPLLILAETLWIATLFLAGIKLIAFGRVLPKRYHQ